VRLTQRQGAYNDAIGFWRAGNEHSNAHCKTDRILNTIYRGDVFTKTGWDILEAAALFCCNKRAIHYSAGSTAERDLSVFADCPVMDRDDIAREADYVYDRVKARFDELRARGRGGRGGRGRGGRGRGRGGRGGGAGGGGDASGQSEAEDGSDDEDAAVGRGRGGFGGRGGGQGRGRGGRGGGGGGVADASDESESEDGSEDAADASDDASGINSDDTESSSDDDDDGRSQYHLHGDALRLARGQALRAAARRDRDAAGIDVQPPSVGALYVWDSPLAHMLYDIRITAVNEESQTASFDYLPPHDNFDGDTRPWAELRPKDGANAGRSMRQRTSRYDAR
jgi:hypothetical protein